MIFKTIHLTNWNKVFRLGMSTRSSHGSRDGNKKYKSDGVRDRNNKLGWGCWI